MSNQTQTNGSLCAVCGKAQAEYPDPDGAQYCGDCWNTKFSLHDQALAGFRLRRLHRGVDAETYLVYPEHGRPAQGRIFAIKERPDFVSLVAILHPGYNWDEKAYTLDGDPNPQTWLDILADAIVGEVVAPWGGGSWYLEIYRTVSDEAEGWQGEI